MIADPEDVAAIQARIEELFLTYDGRTVAAVLGIRSAEAYRTLRCIGLETPESLGELFDYLLSVALADPAKPPTVIYQVDESETKQ